ncbi:hypothetical protein DPMN_151636 [Dreissena polymorpha]|uniref:Uncharacterized protein n=1 Tax=Dreissena polymorpha TaxID=45954 RepID=A0A9D4FHI6_DREPO|nr:hypothetical protein DPMN_151636 [Dreissena polymorpha]
MSLNTDIGDINNEITTESAARYRSAARCRISPLLGTGSSAAMYMIITINTNCITINTNCITSNTNCITSNTYCSHITISNTACSHIITSSHQYHKYRLQSHQSLTIPSLFTSATSNTDCIKSNTDCITSNTDCITSNTECTTSNTYCITSNIYCSHIIKNNTDSRHISHQKYQLQSHQ